MLARPTRKANADEHSASLPFGLGTRGCFGRNLAHAQLKAFLVQLTRTFFFDAIDPRHDSDACVERLTRQVRDCYVRPRPWSQIE